MRGDGQTHRQTNFVSNIDLQLTTEKKIRNFVLSFFSKQATERAKKQITAIVFFFLFSLPAFKQA